MGLSPSINFHVHRWTKADLGQNLNNISFDGPKTSCALMDPSFVSPPETTCLLVDPKTLCLLMDPSPLETSCFLMDPKKLMSHFFSPPKTSCLLMEPKTRQVHQK